MIRRNYKKKFNQIGSISYIKKQLKKLCHILIIDRDKKCLRCYKNWDLQCAHIKSVGAYPHLRFELSNMITLCRRCHLYWAHKEPTEFTEWIIKLLKKDSYDRLNLMARYRGHTKHLSDYETIYHYFSQEVKNLGGNL